MIWECSSLKIAELEDVMIKLFFSFIHLCRVNNFLLCEHNVLHQMPTRQHLALLDKALVRWCAEKQKSDKELGAGEAR